MKQLELNQMENLEGGSNNVINGIYIDCAAIGLLAVGGSIFTFGASLAFGVTLGGAFCTRRCIYGHWLHKRNIK